LAALDGLAEPCPTLHLYAQPADDEVLAAQQAFAGTHPWFEVHRLDARSHFPSIEVPDQVAAGIEEFACRLG
jgi:pimeloyl-ACP methyl ester carboxylesterase